MAGTLQLVPGAVPVASSSDCNAKSCCIQQVSRPLRTWNCRVVRAQCSRPVCLYSRSLQQVHQLGALRSRTRTGGPGSQPRQPELLSARAASSDKGLNLDDSPIELRNVVILASPPEDQKLKLRVDVPGQDTQKAFDILLAGLAKNSPPVPGFRKSKGGKTSTVPKKVLLQLLGESRVRKFVLDEIVRSALTSYVKKEDLKVKDSLTTFQSAEELYDAFEPGKEFGFDAELQLEGDSEDAHQSDRPVDEESSSTVDEIVLTSEDTSEKVALEGVTM